MTNTNVEFKCVCGKEFKSNASLSGHKAVCKDWWLYRDGTLEKYEIYNQKRLDKVHTYNVHQNVIKGKQRVTQNKQFKDQQLEQWLSEKHRCEHCGKILTQYFGSGRFCSKHCANSRVQTDDINNKRSKSLLSTYNPTLSEEEIIQKFYENKMNVSVPRVKYKGEELPAVNADNIKPGFQSRMRIPYSERFWKQVFDNNLITYQQNVNIWKPGPNNYFLDFLINDVDVEIDGAFHELSDVKEKDIKRDKWLISLGYKVYRIKWINPNTEKNKILVNAQIDDLFTFLQIPRIQ